MNKIIKKISAVVCSIAAVMSIASVGVSATCSKGYGNFDVSITSGTSGWFWTTDDAATAYINKCTCSPVENNLMVWIRAQYADGNSYDWIPDKPYYYYDHQVNCSEARKTIKHKNITSAEAVFYATCGDNDIANDPKWVGEKKCTK